MQSREKALAVIQHNFSSFDTADADIKYMALDDLLSELRKNEQWNKKINPSVTTTSMSSSPIATSLSATSLSSSGFTGSPAIKSGSSSSSGSVQLANVLIILDKKLQMQILKCVYNEMVSGNQERGDIKDKCIQILPYLVRQFEEQNVLRLAVSFCKRLAQRLNDTTNTEQEEEEEGESHTLTVVANGIKAMCGAFQTSHVPNMYKHNPEMALSMPEFSLESSQKEEGKQKNVDEEKESIDDPHLIAKKVFSLINKTAKLLLDMIVSTQTEMKLEFVQFIEEQRKIEKHSEKQIISLQAFHDQILSALDIMTTIFDMHGENVSYLFANTIDVLMKLLSHNRNSMEWSESEETMARQVLHSKPVIKKTVECLACLSEHLTLTEFEMMVTRLLTTIQHSLETEEYITLKDLLQVLQKIGMSNRKIPRTILMDAFQSILKMASQEWLESQIDIREYAFMTLESLVRNGDSRMISVFPRMFPVLKSGLSYDPNWVSTQREVVMQDKSKEEEKNVDAEGWEDDGWGDGGDDDGFTADVNDEDFGDVDDGEADNKEDALLSTMNNTEPELLEMDGDELDDDDVSWKVRRAANKCILQVISTIIKTENDFNPNMFARIKNESVNTLLRILISRLPERIIKIKLDVLQSLETLLHHVYLHHQSYTVDNSSWEYINDCLTNESFVQDIARYHHPDIFQRFFIVLCLLLDTHFVYAFKKSTTNSVVRANYIPKILHCIETVIHFLPEQKWLKAASAGLVALSGVCQHIATWPKGDQPKMESWIQDIHNIIKDENNTTHIPVIVACFDALQAILMCVGTEGQHLIQKIAMDTWQAQSQCWEVVDSCVRCLSRALQKSLSENTKQSPQMQNNCLELVQHALKHNKTRISSMELAEKCIATFPINENEEKSITDMWSKITHTLSKLLKQNDASLNYLSLHTLVTILNNFNEQRHHCDLSFPDVVVLFKNALDSNLPLSRMSDYLKLIEHLLRTREVEENLSVFLNVFVLPMLELSVYTNSTHAALYSLWCVVLERMGELLLSKYCKKTNDGNENIKLILDKLLLNRSKSSNALDKDCWLEHVSFVLYPFLTAPEQFNIILTYLQSDSIDDLDVNRVIIGQWWHVLVIRNIKNECCETLRDLIQKYSTSSHENESKSNSNDGTKSDKKVEENKFYGMSNIISAYWLTISDPFSAIDNLWHTKPTLCLHALAKFFTSVSADRMDMKLVEKLLIWVTARALTHYDLCVHVISSLIIHSEIHSTAVAVIQSWLDDVVLRQKLCLDAFTEVLTAHMDHTINKLVDHKWLWLVVSGQNNEQQLVNGDVLSTKFMSKVINLIISRELDLSHAVLRFLRVVIQCSEIHRWSLLLDKLLKRSKGSIEFIETIQLGPITRRIDRSCEVRALSLELLRLMIEEKQQQLEQLVSGVESNNEPLILILINLTQECIQSEDPRVVSHTSAMFQALVHTGLPTAENISEELVKTLRELLLSKETNVETSHESDSTMKERIKEIAGVFTCIVKGVMNATELSYVKDLWNEIAHEHNDHNVNSSRQTPLIMAAEPFDLARMSSYTNLIRQSSLSWLEFESSPIHTTIATTTTQELGGHNNVENHIITK